MNGTVPDMARKRKDPIPPEEPGDRSDRHASGFMVRLPEVFRTQLNLLRDRHYAEHRYRPPLTTLVRQALEDFLRTQGLWPPPADETEGGDK